MTTTTFQTRELQVSRVDGVNYVRVSNGVDSHNAFTFEIDTKTWSAINFRGMKDGKVFARTQQSFKKKFNITSGSHFACLLQMEIRKVYSSLPECQAL